VAEEEKVDPRLPHPGDIVCVGPWVDGDGEAAYKIAYHIMSYDPQTRAVRLERWVGESVVESECPVNMLYTKAGVPKYPHLKQLQNIPPRVRLGIRLTARTTARRSAAAATAAAGSWSPSTRGPSATSPTSG
jgi:hypothetical protein